MQHLLCPPLVSLPPCGFGPRAVLGHTLMAAEPTVSGGAEQVSLSNENEADLEELGGLALFCFVIFCLPVSRWGLE